MVIMRRKTNDDYIREDYCLYCFFRDCDCSTHEDPRITDNCTKCSARKCKENPPNCHGVIKP